jgi:hypothetical protein
VIAEETDTSSPEVTLALVKKQLSDEEHERVIRGKTDHLAGELSVCDCLLAGMDLQDQQFVTFICQHPSFAHDRVDNGSFLMHDVRCVLRFRLRKSKGVARLCSPESRNMRTCST